MVACFGIVFPQCNDLFVLLDTLDEPFEAYARAASGVDTVGVAGCEHSEPGVGEWGVVPVHPRPVEVAVESVCQTVEGKVCGLCGLGIGEDVGLRVGAAGVSCGDEAFRLALCKLFGGEFLVKCNGVVVEHGGEFLVLHSCKSHLDAWEYVLCYLVGALHGIESALIHGQTCLFEPSLFPEMLAESLEETCPKYAVGLGTVVSGDVLIGLRLGVEVAELHFPRNHGVAVDLAVDAAFLAEFDVSVEAVVAVFPFARFVQNGFHHGLELVVALYAPGFVEEDGGGHPLSCPCQHAEIGAQGLKMLLGIDVFSVIAGYGIRLLPEVEVEVLVGRSWQGVLAYVYLQIEVCEYFAVFLAADVKCQCVCSGFGIIGDFESAPYGPHLHGLEFQRSVAVDDVGYQVRVGVHGIVAAGLEAVGDDISHEPCLGGFIFRVVSVCIPHGCHA